MTTAGAAAINRTEYAKLRLFAVFRLRQHNTVLVFMHRQTVHLC